MVTQILFKMVPVPEDRKDLAQDIYLKVFRNLSGFKFQSKISTWIAQIAYNTCLSWIDKKKLYFPGDLATEENRSTVSNEAVYNTPLNSGESEIILFQKELSVILKKEIDALPPVYQTLITLFHNESMSYDELSQVTGLPEGTIKSSPVPC
jgi:RNA polymerase sigma-70 factor (ECF subfamily)